MSCRLLTKGLFCTVTDARRSAEAKRMNQSFKRRLMMSLQGKKKNQHPEAVPVPSAWVDPDDQTLADHQRQLCTEPVPGSTVDANSRPRRGQSTEASASKVARKRSIIVDLDVELVPKRG